MQQNQIKTLAVITDATKLPSFELAKELAEQGHELLLCGTDEEVFLVQDKLLEHGFMAEALLVEFDKSKSVEILFETIQNLDIPLDVCVLNHFQTMNESFSNLSLKQDIEFMNINMMSTVHIIKKVLPLMYPRKAGRIIIQFEKDFSAENPLQNASYEFVHSFAKTLKEETQIYGVRIEHLSKMKSWVERIKSNYLGH
jgi:short-subunit dehydrogenase